MSSSFHDFNRNLIKDLRAHGGKATSGPFMGRDVLILTTKGAKSKEDRENPLVYTQDDGRIVIVASKGGAPTNPSWYHNLKAHPLVTVEMEGRKFQARADVIDGEDYERLYKQHADINPGFWDYRQKTSRKIPVVVLEPLDGDKPDLRGNTRRATE
ncbi:MAG: nitroreductase family deazaflavin-dependent oxidoreductase [Chloroflexi bacterium]|nr:MAG: nitroreductase family deazaflavin-dependent oxidoreductase [Chloroflexota bacterium]